MLFRKQITEEHRSYSPDFTGLASVYRVENKSWPPGIWRWLRSTKNRETTARNTWHELCNSE